MKALSVFILVFSFSLIALGQSSVAVKDSAKVVYTKPSAEDNGVLYLVDGVQSNVLHIKADEILERGVLSGKKLEDALEHARVFFERKIDTIIVITTKHAAIVMYQKKLGLFSGKYRRYLKTHDYNDQRVLYVLNGSPLEGEENKTIKALVDISKDKILRVKFIPHVSKKRVYDYTTDRAALIIQTKT